MKRKDLQVTTNVNERHQILKAMSILADLESLCKTLYQLDKAQKAWNALHEVLKTFPQDQD